MEASTAIPPMGTPEFRAFVQTPEWLEHCHELALQDDAAWEENRAAEASREKIRRMIPTYFIGATAHLDPRIWSRDWRERLAPDHPLRMDFEEGIHGKTEAELQEQDIISLGQLHRATLALTSPQW